MFRFCMFIADYYRSHLGYIFEAFLMNREVWKNVIHLVCKNAIE